MPLSLKCNICQSVWAEMPPFIDTYIVVLTLAFGLETVRKLCYFLPIFNDSCFTSAFGNDNVKQTNKQTTCCPSLSITIIITNDNVLVNLSQKLQSCYKVGDTPRIFRSVCQGLGFIFRACSSITQTSYSVSHESNFDEVLPYGCEDS